MTSGESTIRSRLLGRRPSPPNSSDTVRSLRLVKGNNFHRFMASEHFLQQCRKCYAKLLRLYPKAHQDRFAEGMQQTFNDLCRERIKAQKGVVSFATLIFLETLAGV